MTVSRVKTAILISGRGSNMRALVEAAQEPDFPAEIALVFSNVPDAAGLHIANAFGIPTSALSHRDFGTREAFERALDAKLGDHGVELVCLAGFMRLLSEWFVDHWAGRMINIHPSLLPSFRGLETHARALKAGVLIHGCTVHYVVADLDAGPIVAQAAVPVLAGDTPKTLAARVLSQEHRLYPMALRLVASGATRLEDTRVVTSVNASADVVMIVPGPTPLSKGSGRASEPLGR